MDVPLDDVAAVIGDARVQRALGAALRDRAIRDGYRALRREGMLARVAVDVLCERHGLSDERVRGIVYAKGGRR